MPQSKRRKGAKKYRPKAIGSTYAVPDPLNLFRLIGGGKLDADEEEAACLLLIKTMGEADAASRSIFQMHNAPWPPKTSDDIRRIAQLLIESDKEQTSGATH